MLSLASQLLSLFTFGAGAAEAANLAISAAFLAALLNVAFIGTAVVRADLERGTLALLLSQPVGLAGYVGGRFVGLALSSLLVCALAGAGVTATLLALGAPDGTLSWPLLSGCGRVALAVSVLSAAALAVSSATSRLFAPILLVALFLAGDIADSTPVARVLPNFGVFGFDAASAPSLPWLFLYAALYSVVFLVIAYLRLAVRPPIRTES